MGRIKSILNFESEPAVKLIERHVKLEGVLSLVCRQLCFGERACVGPVLVGHQEVRLGMVNFYK